MSSRRKRRWSIIGRAEKNSILTERGSNFQWEISGMFLARMDVKLGWEIFSGRDGKGR